MSLHSVLLFLQKRAKEWTEIVQKKTELRNALIKLVYASTSNEQWYKGAAELFRKNMRETFHISHGRVRGLELSFVPNLQDLGLLLYSFCLRDGLQAVPIGEIGENWVQNILNNIPTKLKLSYELMLNELKAEFVEQYNISVKKSFVDYILEEPAKSKPVEGDSGARNDVMLDVVPKPWRGSVMVAKKKLLRNLHSCNPVPVYINYVWQAVYTCVVLFIYVFFSRL
jgi:hypothetical protein